MNSSWFVTDSEHQANTIIHKILYDVCECVTGLVSIIYLVNLNDYIETSPSSQLQTIDIFKVIVYPDETII